MDLEQCWLHWLDQTTVDSQCVGPLTPHYLHSNSIRFPEPGQACPLNLTISYDTAVMSAVRRVSNGRVYFCLRLSRRCLHCDVVRKSRNVHTNPMPNKTIGRYCQATNCNIPRWRGIGVFCEAHYQIWMYSQDNWRYQSVPDIPRSFADNIARFIQILNTKNFQLGFRLATILPKLLDANLDVANVYALDTEFHHLPSGRVEATEVAIVDVKTCRIIVNAILDHSRTGLVATRMLRFLRSQQQDPSSPQHVPPVYTAAGMMKQLKDCHFKESDVFVEYSKSLALPDLSLIRSVIERQEDYNPFSLIPGNTGFAIISDIKTLLSQALPLPTYKLQFIFRLLFPQDPLVDCNHSAVIDSLQLARILQLAAELAKKPGVCNLPLDLFQGINELPSLYPSAQINILNQYFIVLDPILGLKSSGKSYN